MPQSEDEDKIDGCWTGFASDELGPFVWCRQVKAMIKQSASVLGITRKKIGSKQILAEGAEVKALDGGDRLRWLPADAPVVDEERPIHVQTAKGPRTALKRVDYVERVTFDFEVWVLKTASAEKRHIGEDDLALILTHAQENGLGADRSCGQGKFDVVEFTRLE